MSNTKAALAWMRNVKPGDFIVTAGGSYLVKTAYLVKRVDEKGLVVTNLGYDYNTRVPFSTGKCNGHVASPVVSKVASDAYRRQHLRYAIRDIPQSVWDRLPVEKLQEILTALQAARPRRGEK